MEALTPRDNYITGEWIAVLLDTYNDGRQASSFEVSLANSQMDSKVHPNGLWDYSWDAVWKSGTAKVAGGWAAEFAIPFSCLRFTSDAEEQSWAVNFQRILSKNVENGWYVLTADNTMADLDNFAVLNGIAGIERSLGAEIRPYTAERRFRYTAEDQWDVNRDLGIDVKLGVSTGIAADFALNPDFGQVEADAVEMNLSHFELFLQEKRPFFLESQNVFDMPLGLFYSRRIGAVADNGEVIPIITGGKLSGSLGQNVRFGILDAVTARVWDDTSLVEPAANYSILRTYKQFGAYSFVGLSGVSKESWEQSDHEATYNRAAAIDGAVELPGNNLLSLAGARSWNQGSQEDGAYRVRLEKIRSTLSYNVSGRYIGEEYNVNGTGFTTETGYYASDGGIYYNLRPEKTFSEIGFGGGVDYSQQIDGEVTGRDGHVEVNATLKNNLHFHLNMSFHGDRFDPYEGPMGRSYERFADYFVHAGTNPFNPFTAWVGVGGGGYQAGGDFDNYMARLRLRPSAALDFGLEGQVFNTRGSDNYNWDIDSFDKRSTDWRSVIARANYIFTPDLNLRLFSQYSRFGMDFETTGREESSEFRTNLLFGWQYLPGSMLYILAETLFEGDEDGNFGKADLGFYAKLTWFLPI
jgi:hypothetical protein